MSRIEFESAPRSTWAADVVISSARTVAGMNFGTGSLTLLGGNLTVGSVANGAFDSTIRNLASSGFTLGGTAAVTLTGPGDPVSSPVPVPWPSARAPR